MNITPTFKTSFCLPFVLLHFFIGCPKKNVQPPTEISETAEVEAIPIPQFLYTLKIQKDIRLGEYFDFMDSLVAVHNERTPYLLSEHLLARANPDLITAFAKTDYYKNIENDVFIYDNRQSIILKKGDSLRVPNLSFASEIFRRQAQTVIDVNIPEFKLRIIENGKELYEFPVRVGQNRTRFLKTAGRDENLRTKTGFGEIVKIKRNPSFINPVDGKEFFVTKRDDKRVTRMPQIPWLHPMIDCHLWGQLIHPTSNPKSLGKAYSNGCVGTGEAAAWYIYFHAPIGTRVIIRYDLEVKDKDGKIQRLKDIYNKKESVDLGEPLFCKMNAEPQFLRKVL